MTAEVCAAVAMATFLIGLFVGALYGRGREMLRNVRRELEEVEHDG